MDNLDMIFLVCFPNFYCHVQLGLRAVLCDVLDIKVPFKFSLYQSEWQHADPGIRFSDLIRFSFPKFFHPWNFLSGFGFFAFLLHFAALLRPGSIYGFTALFFLHVQGQAINCMKTIQSEQDAEKLPTQLSKGFVMLLSRYTPLQAEVLV